MYDLTLTASVAMPATWGKPMNPRGINRGAVADSAIKAIRVLSGRQIVRCSASHEFYNLGITKKIEYPLFEKALFRAKKHPFYCNFSEKFHSQRG